MRKKPNIVLITIDSLRADFVGYQNPNEKNTPFLDKLAKNSYVYTHAIAPSIPTPFCFPAMMLGKLPFTYGKYLGIPDNRNIKTIAQVLQANDYGTYAFLADNPFLYSIYGYQKGFNLYNDGYEKTNKTYLSSLKFLLKIREKIPEKLLRVLEAIQTFLKIVSLSPQHAIAGSDLNKKVVQHFQHKQEKPFFLWLHYMDNHMPYFSGLNKYFFRNKNSIQRVINKIIFYKELSISLRKMELKNDKTAEIFKEAYRSSIKYTDEQVGKIILFLKNKYPNTVFIITSDHGESFMEHGVFGHEILSLYNELIRIPLIINLPFTKSKRITQTVSLVSIPKTIAAIAGVNVRQFQGNNLLTDKVFSSINNLSLVLYKCLDPQVLLGILDNQTQILGCRELWSFTTSREKYVLEKDGDRAEYYDLLYDPQEKINLLKDKAKISSKAIKELSKAIKKYDKLM